MARLLLFFSLIFFFRPPHAEAMPAKLKAVLTCAGYGTVGGALLGTAAMAFGAEPRAIAVGASLGLYAGLIFGSYVILSHEYANGDEESGEGEGDYSSPYAYESQKRWNRYSAFSETRPVIRPNIYNKPTGILQKPVYLNLVSIQF